MSTRDELATYIGGHMAEDREGFGSCDYPSDLADALIAEGWRKMPSRDELARWHDPHSFLPYDGEETALEGWPDDEAARVRYREFIENSRAEGRIQAYEFADSFLALMDRGQ